MCTETLSEYHLYYLRAPLSPVQKSPYLLLTIMTPSVQKALYTLEKKGEFIIGDIIPVSTPGPGEVLMKVMPAGLNPGDWKVSEYGEVLEDFLAVFGFDYAGAIEQLGERVEGFKVGDRLCIFLFKDPRFPG
jgi:D-arabinose 1-dehydrogenase-like Zn-dependent alcohol dehydrogenase